jgi:hypothetical protein
MTDPTLDIARALIWEGYCLYPYRPSALKNRQRILFGTLVPERRADVRLTNASSVASVECLIAADSMPAVRATLRFLFGDSEFEFSFAIGSHDFHRDDVNGCFELRVERLSPSLLKVHASVANRSQDAELGGAHIVLTTVRGRFLSQLDPPESAKAESMRCVSEGLYPVLVGDRVLASPIILYDQPRLAPESAGDLFDATEIEEILSLRILTLTDAERAEIIDPKIRALIDRVDTLTKTELSRLHGRLAHLAIGDRVRVRPGNRADALDVLLAGMDATIVAIDGTVDGDLVSVTIDRDPGRDLGEMGLPGHRFMFRPEELERQ